MATATMVEKNVPSTAATRMLAGSLSLSPYLSLFLYLSLSLSLLFVLRSKTKIKVSVRAFLSTVEDYIKYLLFVIKQILDIDSVATPRHTNDSKICFRSSDAIDCFNEWGRKMTVDLRSQ